MVFLSAILFVLSSPPFDWMGLPLIALIPLILLVEKYAQEKFFWRAFGLGITFGFLINALGTFWWIEVIQQATTLTPWKAIFLSLLIYLYHSVVYGVWILGSALLRGMVGVPLWISMPLALFFFETVFSFILPSPFQSYLAISVWKVWPLTQFTEWGGPPLVSGLVVLMNIGLKRIFTERLPEIRSMFFVIVLILGSGIGRFLFIKNQRQKADKISVALLQTPFKKLSQKKRNLRGAVFAEELRQAMVQVKKQNQSMHPSKKIAMIFMPETVWPYLVDRHLIKDYPEGHPWKIVPADLKIPVVVGALTHQFGKSDLYNSALVVDAKEKIIHRYDKQQLLPFVEEIPDWVRFFPQSWVKQNLREAPLLKGRKSRSKIHDFKENQKMYFNLLLCSEDLNAHYVEQEVKKDSQFMVTLANHSWFPNHWASAQHLALAHFRAIEQRKDLIRTTNQGVSNISLATGESLLFYLGNNDKIQSHLVEVALLGKIGKSSKTEQ